MKERTTFIHAAHGAYDPHLPSGQRVLQLESIRAAREDRVTLSLNELPQEIWLVLKQCHEVHIRWVSPVSYQSSPPFASKLSPGLQTFFTPLKDSLYVSGINQSSRRSFE